MGLITEMLSIINNIQPVVTYYVLSTVKGTITWERQISWVCKATIFISDFLLNTIILTPWICYVWIFDSTNNSVTVCVYTLATYKQPLPHLNSFGLEVVI